MMRPVLSWITALVLVALSAGWAEAGVRWPHCRPYTVENTCPPGHRLCHLKMVYAPAQSPGVDATGYWYGIPHPAELRHGRHHHYHHVAHKHQHRSSKHHVRHHARHRHHANVCGYRCWYKHSPHHGLPFGD